MKLPNRKTPATAEDAAATRQDAFANSVAALRKATGTTEARVVPCRCADDRSALLLALRTVKPGTPLPDRLDRQGTSVPAGQVNTGIGLVGPHGTAKLL